MGRNGAAKRGGKKGGVKPKAPKRSPAPPRPIPPPGGSGMSGAFQLTELQMAHADKDDSELIWMPHRVTAPQKITSKWIYAFRFNETGVGQPTLAMEYQADKNGALSFTDGDKRRDVDVKSAPAPVPTAAVRLPLMVNGKLARYAFVVMRARLPLEAIRNVENGLHPIYTRYHLGDNSIYVQGKSGDFFLAAVDPLTLAERLKEQYHQACVEATNAVWINKKNPKRDQAAYESRKYELAKMIRDNLLEPKDGPKDPYDIAGSLINRGGILKNDIEKRESQLRTLNWGRRNAARELVRFFSSKIWSQAYTWYLGHPGSAAQIGHMWLDAFFRNIDRLGETPEGRKFFAELLAQRQRNVLSYLFAGDPVADGDWYEHAVARFSIMRKAATAAVLGLCEMGPALAVHGMVREANKVYLRTIERLLGHAEVTIVTVTATGQIQEIIGAVVETEIVQIKEWKGAKADLEEWIGKSKAEWPEEHKHAHASELATRLFMGIEAMNFMTKIRDIATFVSQQPFGKRKSGSVLAFETIGATLDLIVALEEPIVHFAHSFAKHGGHAAGHGAAHAGHAASEASHAEKTAAVTLGKKEGRAIFGEVIPTPVIFKAAGAASAAIDAVLYFIEAGESMGKGDVGAAAGNYLVSGGSAIMFAGSILNAGGYIATSAALASDGALAAGAIMSAAAATMLVVGVVIVTIGYIVLEVLKTTSWQKFADFCHWGNHPAGTGWDTWSGGPFSAWTDSKEGYEKQIQVLTAMLCSFSVSGGSYGGSFPSAHTVTVHFGTIPPKARLDVEFWIRYQNHESKRLGYVIELDSQKLVEHTHAALGVPRIQWHWNANDRLTGVTVEAERQVNARVQESWCKVVIRYARSRKGATGPTGTIPIKDPLVYRIVEDARNPSTELLHSLDIGKEEEEGEGAGEGKGEGGEGKDGEGEDEDQNETENKE